MITLPSDWSSYFITFVTELYAVAAHTLKTLYSCSWLAKLSTRTIAVYETFPVTESVGKLGFRVCPMAIQDIKRHTIRIIGFIVIEFEG